MSVSVERQIREFAREKMEEHGLLDWDFKFNNTKSAIGQCSHLYHVIYFSRQYLHLDESVWKNTILHEIAHALAGVRWKNGRRMAHDKVWRDIFKSIGGNGKTRTSVSQDDAEDYPWVGKCPTCSQTVGVSRMPQVPRICARCTKTRKYQEKFVFQWKKHGKVVPMPKHDAMIKQFRAAAGLSV